MSRRHRAPRRHIDPDPEYNSLMLAKFINRVMVDGKKSVARKIVYGALLRLKKRLNEPNAIELFDQALENARPSVEVKSRRIGGATYQVPIEIPTNRSISLAMKWIIQHARSKSGRPMVEALAGELADCVNGQGTTVKKRDDTHRMAEANKAFAHYKW